MNLYEIDNAIMECVDEETGEIIDVDRLDQLQMERDVKIENIACWIKNLASDADQIKIEVSKLNDKKKVAENKAERLKKFLKEYLHGDKFKTAKVTVSYRKTASVDVTDMSILPEKYKKYAEPEPRKTDIKADINAGIIVPGAVIVNGQSMIIK